MPINKVFQTSNKVGYKVKYKKGTTEIASQSMGGVCMAMVLTWIKEAIYHEASGHSIDRTIGDITGASLNIVAVRHHSLKYRLNYARRHNLSEEIKDSIKADYLASYGLTENAAGMFQPAGQLASVRQITLFDDGYSLLLIGKADNADDETLHAFGIKWGMEGKCYFLDPNAGLFESDDWLELLNYITGYIQINYAAQGKPYAGGWYGTQPLKAA